MPYEITKTYPADFPSVTTGKPDAQVLEVEINASISSTTCIGIRIPNAQTGVLQFDVEPSAADLTAIDNVCAAHTGESFADGVQRDYTEAEQTVTSTTYQTMGGFQSGPLSGGDYLVTWYGEISVATADSTSGCLARFLYGGVERAESSNATSFYVSFSGSAIITVPALSRPILQMQLRRAGTTNTAKIRRIRIAMAPLHNGLS